MKGQRADCVPKKHAATELKTYLGAIGIIHQKVKRPLGSVLSPNSARVFQEPSRRRTGTRGGWWRCQKSFPHPDRRHVRKTEPPLQRTTLNHVAGVETALCSAGAAYVNGNHLRQMLYWTGEQTLDRGGGPGVVEVGGRASRPFEESPQRVTPPSRCVYPERCGRSGPIARFRKSSEHWRQVRTARVGRHNLALAATLR